MRPVCVAAGAQVGRGDGGPVRYGDVRALPRGAGGLSEVPGRVPGLASHALCSHRGGRRGDGGGVRGMHI